MSCVRETAIIFVVTIPKQLNAIKQCVWSDCSLIYFEFVCRKIQFEFRENREKPEAVKQ